MNLELSLKKQLEEIKMKKKTLVMESDYVNSRINKILENIDFNNDKHLLILRSDLIKEIRTLKENNIINEELNMSGVVDNIGFLGKKLGRGIWNRMFIGLYKEIGKSLGFDTDSFMFNTIVAGFQLLEWNDIIKILGGDCDLLTRKLTQALIAGLENKIRQKLNMSGPGYDIIGLTLVDIIGSDANSPMGKIVQSKLSPHVCRILEEWLGSVEKKGAEAKKSETSTKQSAPDVLTPIKSAVGL